MKNAEVVLRPQKVQKKEELKSNFKWTGSSEAKCNFHHFAMNVQNQYMNNTLKVLGGKTKNLLVIKDRLVKSFKMSGNEGSEKQKTLAERIEQNQIKYQGYIGKFFFLINSNSYAKHIRRNGC